MSKMKWLPVTTTARAAAGPQRPPRSRRAGSEPRRAGCRRLSSGRIARPARARRRGPPLCDSGGRSSARCHKSASHPVKGSRRAQWTQEIPMTVALADEDLETARRRGFGVAYRMLGSVAEAEDVAQEALLRLARTDSPIDEPAAWITTVATRLSIDALPSARLTRETYIGPWLPEPLIGDQIDIAAEAELADSLSQAFLVILERLTPVERAAFILRDVFDYDYRSIAEIIGRSEANTRQIVGRARKQIDACRPRFEADAATRNRLLERFVAAAQDGDLEGLEQLLAEDAALYSDGGGKV